MLKNQTINLKVVEKVALALGELKRIGTNINSRASFRRESLKSA